MNRYALYHCGLDVTGHRHWRMKPAPAIRRCTQHKALLPKLVQVHPCALGREVWRNGLHRRRWYAIAAQVRTDRRGFLATLPRPALLSPVLATSDW